MLAVPYPLSSDGSDFRRHAGRDGGGAEGRGQALLRALGPSRVWPCPGEGWGSWAESQWAQGWAEPVFCLKVGFEWTPSLVAGLRPFGFELWAPQPGCQQSSGPSVHPSVYEAACMDRHWAQGRVLPRVQAVRSQGVLVGRTGTAPSTVVISFLGVEPGVGISSFSPLPAFPELRPVRPACERSWWWLHIFLGTDTLRERPWVSGTKLT